jgi:hypothetical protein
MGLLSTPKEQVRQVLLRDDMTFLIRPLTVEDAWKIEFNDKKKKARAFMLHHKLQKRFDGYKNMPACNLTVDITRDVVYDPFNQLNVREKPSFGVEKVSSKDVLKKDMMTKIADSKCYRIEQDAKPTSSYDKTQVFLGVTMLMLVLAVLLKVGLHYAFK